jgi:hypothetical protein
MYGKGTHTNYKTLFLQEFTTIQLVKKFPTLWDPKFRYFVYIHIRPSLDSILNQCNSFHIFTTV